MSSIYMRTVTLGQNTYLGEQYFTDCDTCINKASPTTSLLLLTVLYYMSNVVIVFSCLKAVYIRRASPGLVLKYGRGGYFNSSVFMTKFNMMYVLLHFENEGMIFDLAKC